MRILLLFFFLCCSDVLQAAQKKEMLPPHLQTGCTIYSLAGRLIGIYPGEMCVFFGDGSFLSGSKAGLRFFTKDNEVKWEMAGHFHHQLKLSVDGKRILALSSDVVKVEGKQDRIDKVLIISLEGKVLHEAKADFMLREAAVDRLKWVVAEKFKEDTKIDTESSHFNSIYEVPRVTSGVKNTAFQEGDIIVNGLSQGIFVLSPDMKTLKIFVLLSNQAIHHIHDVQVSLRGHFLLFNNQTSDATELGTFSTIQEIEFLNQKKIFEFKATPKEAFFSSACGGVQELGDDLLLFSDNLNGTFIYSRSKKIFVQTIRQTHERNGQRLSLQDVKALDLTDFLAKRNETNF